MVGKKYSKGNKTSYLDKRNSEACQPPICEYLNITSVLQSPKQNRLSLSMKDMG